MSRNDTFYEDYNIMDDNPDLHTEDNFFLKSPTNRYESGDELLEQDRTEDVENEAADESFPDQVNPEEIAENIVRFYSLSYSVDETDLVSMFQCDVSELTSEHILLIRYPDGKLTGTAFIHLSSKEQVVTLLKSNGRMLRGRLLMIMPSTEGDIQECQEKAEKGLQIRLDLIKSGHGKLLTELRTPCVHIKGVCLTSNHNVIRRFFEPLRIPSQSVFLIKRQPESPFLEAYVQFRDVEDSEKALSRHNELMDGNHVEVYPVSKNKMIQAIDIHGVLDKGHANANARADCVATDVIDARLRARQQIMKDQERQRSRSPPYSPHSSRSGYLSRDRDSDPLSRLRDIDLLRDRGRLQDRDRYGEKERRYETGARTQSLGYGSKSDSVRSSRYDRYPRDDMRDRLDEYRSSPPSRRSNRRSPYSDKLSSRSRDLGDYSSELTRNPIVRMTGLPSSAIIYDLIDYFQGFDLKIDSVRIQCNEDGSPNGKAFVRFPSFSQAMLAIDQCKGKGIDGSHGIDLSLI